MDAVSLNQIRLVLVIFLVISGALDRLGERQMKPLHFGPTARIGFTIHLPL
jgi:hypothetical protein